MRHNGSHLLGGSTAAKATAELGLVGTGGTSLVSRGAAAKATTLAAVTLTVAAEAATATEALAAGGACAGGGALQGPLGLLQGGRHHILGQAQVVAQVVDALVSQEPASTCVIAHLLASACVCQ